MSNTCPSPILIDTDRPGQVRAERGLTQHWLAETDMVPALWDLPIIDPPVEMTGLPH